METVLNPLQSDSIYTLSSDDLQFDELSIKSEGSINLKDLQRPFPISGQKTISIRPIVGIINQISEVSFNKREELKQHEEEEDDDNYCEPTEKQEVMKKQTDVKYITQAKDLKDESTTNSSNNDDDIEGIDLMSNLPEPKNYKEEDAYLQNISNQYMMEYQNDEEEIKSRIRDDQQICKDREGEFKDLNEDNIKAYILKNSHHYKKVVDVNKIAQGGEAIVFRLEHKGTNEVVIKTALRKENVDDNTQSSFIDIMAETRHLRLLQSNKYIAAVKEELIRRNDITKQTESYCVIVERAKFSLKDLLHIWRSQEKNNQLLEYYSPEKLAYYFYQAMQIIAYLHQRNFYYGDMKPHNLLVFRNQQIKVGDLGISMKLDPNQSEQLKLYKLKGLTTAYASSDMMTAYSKRLRVSKKQLFEFDKFSLIRTFQDCVYDVKLIHTNSKFPNICSQMINDLISSSIIEVLKKYSYFFAENFEFIQTLNNHMKDEVKYEAIEHISSLSKYRLLLDQKLVSKVNKFKKDQTKISKYDQMMKAFIEYNPKLQDLQDYYDPEIFLENEQVLLNINEVSQQWKQLVLMQVEAYLLTNETKFDQNAIKQLKIVKEFSQYFLSSNEQLINFTQYGLKFKASSNNQEIIQELKKQYNDLEQFIKWVQLTQSDSDIYQQIKTQLETLDITQFSDVLLFSYYKVSQLALYKSYEQNYDQSVNYEEEFEKQRTQIQKLKNSKEIGKSELTKLINNSYLYSAIHFNNCEYYEKSISILMQFDYQTLATQRNYFDYIHLAHLYFETHNKLIHKSIESEMQKEIALITLWQQRVRDLCGEYDQNTMKFYGILGKTIVEMHRYQQPQYTYQQLNENPNFQTGILYLEKFSQLSVVSYIKYLKVLDENNLFTLTRVNIHDQLFEIAGLDKLAMKGVMWTLFNRFKDTKNTEVFMRDLIEDIYYEGKESGLLRTLCQSQELFELFMRYFKSIIIEDETNYRFDYQPKYEYENIHIKLDVEAKMKILRKEAKLKIYFVLDNYKRVM